MRVLAMTLLFLCLSASAANAKRAACNNVLSRQADSEVGHLKTWRQIYRSFRLYSACDEGSIAEGYSEAVVRLLAAHWIQFSQLQNFAARDDAFRGFVLRH